MYENMVNGLMLTEQEHHHSRSDSEYHDAEEGNDTDEENDELEGRFAEIEADLETLIWETHEISEPPRSVISVSSFRNKASTPKSTLPAFKKSQR